MAEATACEALAALFSDQRCFSLVQDALTAIPKEDVPQILASCCLKLTAQPSQQATALDILDFLHIAGPEYLKKQFFTVQEELLLDRETCRRLLAFLHCNSLIDCRLLALSVFMFSYSRQPDMLRAALREILISLLGPDIISLAEPILAALKPRLLDDINDPRLALRAYLVVMQLTRFVTCSTF
ncbi:hypothetical protein, conserved [Eimeria praecox]|uniref:Uncharacterized protein n=1 Tax=Eimeria praecox TaxID=51316 RepID=U6H3Q4_9EIME|nr:hypothetical protein, conserved [Eimeria praecox]